MTTESATPPIVDPEGEWIWVPVTVAPTQTEAVEYARSYWSERPCYNPWPIEHFKVVGYDDADEDGQATLDEYGGAGVALPCADNDSDGRPYWPIHCYPDAT